MDELGEGWQALFDHLEGRVRVLVAAKVGDGPGHVSLTKLLRSRFLNKIIEVTFLEKNKGHVS